MKKIESLTPAQTVLSHPEHGHHIYHDNMVIACVFQRNLDAEEREQRALD